MRSHCGADVEFPSFGVSLLLSVSQHTHRKMTERTLVSFCSFEGGIKVIHITPVETKSSQKYRIRILDVGLFDGIRKVTSADFEDVPEETDELLINHEWKEKDRKHHHSKAS